MKVKVREGAVPFVITYRKILSKPKIERRRQFVGAIQFAKNATVKLIELFESMAFETVTKVEDPGRSVAVHWAIDVEDPWDATPGVEMTLVATRMGEDMPPCGAHFEIISPQTQPRRRTDDMHEDTYGSQSYDEREGDPWLDQAATGYDLESRDLETDEEQPDDLSGFTGAMPVI